MMLRLASLALLLLAVPAGDAPAQDHAAAPANTYIGPLQSTTGATAPPMPPLPEAKTLGRSDDCTAALRREDGAHQQQAAATGTLPAPLVLPPECGGVPTPPASK